MDINDLIYIDTSGYHYADYPTFLQWRTDQYTSIFGADTYLEPDSQDGQLIAVQAKADFDTAAKGAAVYNSFSPATAQGLGLSRVVKINGIKKGIATNSTADLTLVGQSGTVVGKIGSLAIAQDTLGQKWIIPVTTIPGGGSIVATATAELVGAVGAGAGTINQIYTPTLGWQTVTNVADATPGAPVESDANLRIRQTQSTALPSLTVFDGTIGAVEAIDGVTKTKGYENPTNATDANGLPPHSIAIVVAGGTVANVAQAIQRHKTPGTQTVGTTSQLVYDSHGMPITINFYRPTIASIKAQVTISTKQGWSTDFIAQIKTAIAATINAGGIGETVQITKLFTPAYLTGTPASQTFDITLMELKKNAGSYGTTNIALTFLEQPVCIDPTDVNVIVT